MSQSILERVAFKGLHLLDAETAHNVTLKALKHGFGRAYPGDADPRLAQTVCGLNFPNPLGMAAGFDKNGDVPDAVLKMGFGFTEAGTVTPKPQPGNPKPRVFRLTEDRGVINRFGFNNEGHESLLRKLKARGNTGGVLGINIGANKDASDRPADYVAGIRAFAGLASYFTVNISSPNTPGLRNLQAKEALRDLLSRVLSARNEMVAEGVHSVPVFLKIAPDMADGELEDVVGEVLEQQVDGLIVSNTTLSRSGLTNTALGNEAGGLSGAPLFRRATVALAKARRFAGPELPIVGVGGIDSAETAWIKITAGADLLQVYSALVFQGPVLVRDILEGLSKKLDETGAASLRDVRDTNLEAWANAEV
ncbi:dihydroorotate oxidase A [Roseibium hamelinense]|uniref:Dihydroorotate dehydrogenase (quinone) n=1 Tax=Roseibium hamelinense TaxID=150831 RepID=A0A562STJ6_9HYPH|nr:quinone-dependent dihydroorotate dehydrogenase [Roseibium hamelinense]MTI43048.1 quinone-dependent dihydroorotate dehydrogenase [Roseibium hamelinense]TWI84649.1 dihydroorotate oxidase A [Roseibium hamelinense]